MDPRAGLDGCGKSCPHRDSIPGPSKRAVGRQEEIINQNQDVLRAYVNFAFPLHTETAKHYFEC